MTDIHRVIDELKALEAKQPSASKAAMMGAVFPHLIAYIDRLEAVASAARGVVRTDDIAGNGEWSHMLKCIAALDTLERDE